jgi:hypothetical protein
MKRTQNIGISLFLLGLLLFISILFLGKYQVTSIIFDNVIKENNIKSDVFIHKMEKNVIGKEFSSSFGLSSEITDAIISSNKNHVKNKEYNKKIWNKYHSLNYTIIKASGKGLIIEHKGLFWWLTFGLGIFGALLYIIPSVITLGPKGIKNNGIYLNSATNRGWIGWFVFVFLVVFYLLLYFAPDYIVNWTYIVDPISQFLSGNLAGQWFLYGFLYCVVMMVMAVRMYIKYRHNKYQILRTTSVLFFQIVFAFLIPEIMVRFQMPWYDFKNAFPLDYDFFFKWNIKQLISSGGIGLFILVWGIVLTLIIVPLMVYFFGKRW